MSSNQSLLVIAAMIWLLVSITMSAPTTAPATTAASLQFRLVLEPGDQSPADIFVDSASGERLSLGKKVELDQYDVARAYLVSEPDSQTAIGVDFTDSGSAKFAAVTAASIHHRIAIVFNGSILAAPMIQTQLSKSAIITGGGASGFSEQKANAIIDAINGAKSGTTTQPAQ